MGDPNALEDLATSTETTSRMLAGLIRSAISTAEKQ
jgi:hypothetical protein